MNDIWSKYVQGASMLYFSRKLRFHDMFAAQYKALFSLSEEEPLKILEIGCGPGALAGALRRWYPKAEITGVDRDSEFISFARAHETGIRFIEGDATKLPFADDSFDVTISNTVAEHIEPAVFYTEQRRVLKPNGVCLVLSTRKGIHISAPCLSKDEFEMAFWKKADACDDTMERFGVCRYPMSEAEMPKAMAENGFMEPRTGYVVADLTPDDPKYSPNLAREMIEANRFGEMDSIASAGYTMRELCTEEELAEMRRRVNRKYDERVRLYEAGEKIWDTNVSVILVLRGRKA